jgi:hypothetical protein
VKRLLVEKNEQQHTPRASKGIHHYFKAIFASLFIFISNRMMQI